MTTIVSVRPVMNFIQGRELKEPTILFCDNIAAVLLSENNTSSRRLKHIAASARCHILLLEDNSALAQRGIALSPRALA